eukprot:14586552-Alexandrium_andersonii.AAC.1
MSSNASCQTAASSQPCADRASSPSRLFATGCPSGTRVAASATRGRTQAPSALAECPDVPPGRFARRRLPLPAGQQWQ